MLRYCDTWVLRCDVEMLVWACDLPIEIFLHLAWSHFLSRFHLTASSCLHSFCCTEFQFVSSAGTLTFAWLYSLQVAAIITLIVIVIEFAWLLFTPTLTHAQAHAHAHNDENKTALITRAIVIENHIRIRYCNGKSSECERTIRPTTTKTTHTTLTTFAKGLKRLATQ